MMLSCLTEANDGRLTAHELSIGTDSSWQLSFPHEQLIEK